jgi:hypothetical protein
VKASLEEWAWTAAKYAGLLVGWVVLSVGFAALMRAIRRGR